MTSVPAGGASGLSGARAPYNVCCRHSPVDFTNSRTSSLLFNSPHLRPSGSGHFATLLTVYISSESIFSRRTIFLVFLLRHFLTRPLMRCMKSALYARYRAIKTHLLAKSITCHLERTRVITLTYCYCSYGVISHNLYS